LVVLVGRVYAGGDAPPDPPSVVTSLAHSPFLCFLKKRFLANERDHILGEALENYKKPHKTRTNKWRA
jgi:hypothetical protein